MSYKEKPQIKLYKYQNSVFVLQAIIDDYIECSFENNRFEAGQFSITINYNIPNALLFERGLFVQFGNNPYNFGEIFDVSDSIGSDGKGSQIRNITGYDIRYIFKRRVIKNLNNNDTWAMTAKGELCMRNLIQDQCGINAEEKRRLPVINTIPSSENAIGSEYSVSESFSNLYDVLTTIATQTEIGWRLNFNGTTLTLEFYSGTDRHLTVRFDTNYESLSEGKFTDSSSSFANAIFVGGKGTGSERDIYEGENAIEGNSPSGLDRFEAWDNQSEMTTEEDYAAEALSLLSQYGQTLQVSGKGLAKCPYEYGKEYEVGDVITIAFSGKSAVVQILSVTEHWAFGNYNLDFEFGKPQPDLNQQLQLLMRKIQKASSKTNSTESVKWYTMTTNTTMDSGDVTFNTVGFTGNIGTGKTFTFYLDNEKTGSKSYAVYVRNLTGTGKLTLTTGRNGVSNVELNPGNYVGKVYIDEYGNIILESMTATSIIESGNNQPVTSGAVAEALNNKQTIVALDLSNFQSVTRYVSLLDVTDWYNNTTGTLPRAFVGTVEGYRLNTRDATMILASDIVSYFRQSQTISDITYNNKVGGVTYLLFSSNNKVYFGFRFTCFGHLIKVIGNGSSNIDIQSFGTSDITEITDVTLSMTNRTPTDSVTSGSNNLITSGGVATALNNYQSKNYVTLSSNDANDVGEGIYNCYRVGGGCANIPVARIGLLTSYKYVSRQYIRITQEYSTNDDAVSTAEKYLRWGMSNNSGTSYTWTAWKKIVVSSDITPTINNSLLQFNNGYSIIEGDIILSGNLLILNICIQRTTTGTGTENVGTLQKTPLSYINSFIGVGGRYSVTGIGYVFISPNSNQLLLDFNGQSYARLNLVLPVS